MRSTEIQASRRFRILLPLLIAAFALARFESAEAQYYYQPAPDYYHNDTASGTFMGGALGVTGAIVGGRKDRGEGALIGAGVGAVTGNLLGRSKDHADERRAAFGAASVGQLNQQAAAAAVTDYDLLQMTRAGVSEDVIISTMRSRGARIDLTPQSLIALKQQGVSDRVVMAAQQMSAAPGYVGGPGPVVVRELPPPTTVIVEPACHPYHYHGWHDWHHHHHYRHHGHGHGHFSIGF